VVAEVGRSGFGMGDRSGFWDGRSLSSSNNDMRIVSNQIGSTDFHPTVDRSHSGKSFTVKDNSHPHKSLI
jgi:hypothetical protein